MVNDDTPSSYLPDCTPGMMSSNFADCQSVFRPSFAATALNRSTSNPMTVLPSVLMAAGTFAASAESTAVDGVGPAVPDSLFFSPHAASGSASAATASTATAKRLERVMGVGVIVDYLPRIS